MKKWRKFIIIVFLLSFTNICYAGIDLRQLYNLTDKSKLQSIIDKTEKVIEQNPSDKDSLKVLGIAYHNLGILKVSGSPNKSVEYLEKVKNISPADYETLAYLGSATTMVARDSWNIITKTSNVNKGINMIDRSVNKAPDNITVRMVRAKNSLSLPESFNRKHLAMKDFLHIESLIKRVSSEEIGADIKAEVFYMIGTLYNSGGDTVAAKIYFKKTVEVLPDSEWGIKARKKL